MYSIINCKKMTFFPTKCGKIFEFSVNASSHIEETTVESDFWDSFNVFADQRLKEKLLIILELVHLIKV